MPDILSFWISRAAAEELSKFAQGERQDGSQAYQIRVFVDRAAGSLIAVNDGDACCIDLSKPF